MPKYKTVDEYIQSETYENKEILNKIREIIKECAVGVEEKISYGMPTYYLNGVLLHFLACKKHLGLYPRADGIEAFKGKLSAYKTSKGAVRFPYSEGIPYELIREIVQYRVTQNIEG